MHKQLQLRLIVAAISIGCAIDISAATLPAAASPAASFTLAQHPAVLRTEDAITGALSAAEPMHIEVALKLRNSAQLQTFIVSAKTSTMSMVQRTMTSAEFNANHAPTVNQARAVAAYLNNAGFTNVVISPNRMLVSADGRADTARAAFNTTFARVRTHDGRDAFMNTDSPQVPAALKDSVLSVIGLQSVHQAHILAVRAQAGFHPQGITGHNPIEFSSIYGGSGLATAAGVTIGIVTQGQITQTITDLNSFTAQNGLSTVTTQTVNTNGTSADTSGVIEWNLDSQDIVGMAGGKVGKLVFYNIPTLSNANLTADFNAIVSANATKIINVSLGECESSAQGDGSAAADDQIFQQGIAQGQTFSVSSGDSGADECGDGGITPSYPASSPGVVSVGGTTLNATTTTYGSETVWSGGGGSPSKFEAKPSWQAGVLSGTKRGVPDLSFDADPNSGAKIILNGANTQVGGTSLSSPLFVGSWARLLATNPSLTFAAPYLYQTLTAADYHDVTSGSNGGETASFGWDLATGFGSFKLDQVSSHIGGGSAPSHLGMTWASVAPANLAGLVHVGSDGITNPYSGDTSVGTALPEMCIRVTNSPAVPGVAYDTYNGWSGGAVAFTAAIAGSQLTSRAVADGKCAGAFGTGWRMAEFHDGNGWHLWAFGSIPAGVTRFWTAINDQQANPWNTTTGKAMSWAAVTPSAGAIGTVHVGSDATTNPYIGDTSALAVLPILCIDVINSPLPANVPVDGYNGWAAGTIAFTSAMAGSQLTSRAVADGKCVSAFGSGWRMAEFHDGGGWHLWAFGSLPAGVSRFWTAINDQPANLWN